MDDTDEGQHDAPGISMPAAILLASALAKKLWRQAPLQDFLDDLLIRCAVEVVEHTGKTFPTADLLARLLDRYLARLKDQNKHPRTGCEDVLSIPRKLLECTPFKTTEAWKGFHDMA